MFYLELIFEHFILKISEKFKTILTINKFVIQDGKIGI